MDDIFQWIDEHQEEMVAELQKLCQQPSISAQGIGLEECAELLKHQMWKNGFDNAHLEPVQDAPPLVYATAQSDNPNATVHLFIIPNKQTSRSWSGSAAVSSKISYGALRRALFLGVDCSFWSATALACERLVGRFLET